MRFTRRLLAALTPLAAGPSSLPRRRRAGLSHRPVTLIVPFSAGGGVDAIARLLAEKLRDTLKQNIVVENKPGASGMLGAQYVAKAAPDGYTLLLGSAGETAINPYVYKGRMLYSPEKDLAPVTLVTRVPNVLVAGPPAGVQRGRAGRARARQARCADLRHQRRGQSAAPERRAAAIAGRHHHGPCAVQGRVRPVGRRGQRQCRHDLRQLRGRRALHPGRTREGAGGDVGHARQLRQDIPPSPRPRACRPTRWKTGSACTRPRARRRRWCSGCTRRCATRWPIRRWRSACASRRRAAPLPPAEFAAFIASESKQYAAIVERADITADK